LAPFGSLFVKRRCAILCGILEQSSGWLVPQKAQDAERVGSEKLDAEKNGQLVETVSLLDGIVMDTRRDGSLSKKDRGWQHIIRGTKDISWKKLLGIRLVGSRIASRARILE
jgi:ribosome biogenesis protein Tsr3